MSRYIIIVGGCELHTVTAPDDQTAIEKWLDEQGWESRDHAASEYEGITANDIHAVRVG